MRRTWPGSNKADSSTVHLLLSADVSPNGSFVMKEESVMKSRITVVTIGVDDLEKSLRFYRDGLGLATEGIK